jgi:hypothetical protein
MSQSSTRDFNNTLLDSSNSFQRKSKINALEKEKTSRLVKVQNFLFQNVNSRKYSLDKMSLQRVPRRDLGHSREPSKIQEIETPPRFLQTVCKALFLCLYIPPKVVQKFLGRLFKTAFIQDQFSSSPKTSSKLPEIPNKQKTHHPAYKKPSNDKIQ